MRRLVRIVFSVAVLSIFALPVFAADDDFSNRLSNVEKGLEKIQNTVGSWSFYGKVIISDWYTDYDEEAGDTQTANLDLQSNSRFGANFKRGNIGGKAEIGLNDDSNAVQTRYLYMYYDLDNVRILFGQDDTPIKTNVSKQAFQTDCGMQPFAPANISRRTQLKIAVNGFEFALLKLHTKGLVPGLTTGDVAEYLPKIAASYAFNVNNFWAKVYGGFQTYRIETDPKDYTVNSYIAGLSGGVDLDPFYVNAAFMTGQNCAQYGLSNMIGGVDKPNDAWVEDGDLKDQQTIGATLVAGYKASKRVSFETGFGYVTKDSDRAIATDDDEAMGGYLQTSITVLPGWDIKPEVGFYDYKKDLRGQDEGSMWYAGIQNVVSF